MTAFRGALLFALLCILRGGRDNLGEGFDDLVLVVDLLSGVPGAPPHPRRVRNVLSGTRFQSLGVRLTFALRVLGRWGLALPRLRRGGHVLLRGHWGDECLQCIESEGHEHIPVSLDIRVAFSFVRGRHGWDGVWVRLSGGGTMSIAFSSLGGKHVSITGQAGQTPP